MKISCIFVYKPKYDSTILCRVNKDLINRCHYLVNDKTNEVCFKELKGWKRYES